MIGEPQETIVTILKNDHANGVLEFTKNLIEVSEDSNNNREGFIRVVRNAGTFGKVSCPRIYELFFSSKNVMFVQFENSYHCQ